VLQTLGNISEVRLLQANFEAAVFVSVTLLRKAHFLKLFIFYFNHSKI